MDTAHLDLYRAPATSELNTDSANAESDPPVRRPSLAKTRLYST